MTLRVASINQDPGIDPRRQKGAAVHLALCATRCAVAAPT